MHKDPRDFSDLEDSAMWDGDGETIADADVDTPAERLARDTVGAIASQATTAKYVENCPKCRGSGVWRVTMRGAYECFKCKGTGKLHFRTSPEQRAANRERAARKKKAKADAKRNDAELWLLNNPDYAAFLEQTWEFPQSLREGLFKYGSLTEKQVAAIDRCLIKQAAKREARAAEQSDIDLTGVPNGLYAVPGGDTRLKVRINAPTRGKWAGWVFVDDGAEYGQRQKYGAQRPGERYNGKILDALRTIIADPFAASKAYGQLVGVCGVCGRRLEDEKSVAAGIGPVCAKKF